MYIPNTIIFTWLWYNLYNKQHRLKLKIVISKLWFALSWFRRDSYCLTFWWRSLPYNSCLSFWWRSLPYNSCLSFWWRSRHATWQWPSFCTFSSNTPTNLWITSSTWSHQCIPSKWTFLDRKLLFIHSRTWSLWKFTWPTALNIQSFDIWKLFPDYFLTGESLQNNFFNCNWNSKNVSFP